jgi:hypothetical protein
VSINFGILHCSLFTLFYLDYVMPSTSWVQHVINAFPIHFSPRLLKFVSTARSVCPWKAEWSDLFVDILLGYPGCGMGSS